MASTINADNGAISGSAGLKSTADSSGVLGLQTNGTTRLTIDTSGNVGIGTTAPTTKLTLSANTALPSAGTITGTNLWQVGADSTTNAITLDTFAGAAFIYGRRANGTAASPSAISGADSTILRMAGRGYGTTGYSSGDRIEFGMYSGAAWTDASQSTYFVWKNTPIGSTTLTETMRLDASGNLGLGVTPSAWSGYKAIELPNGSFASYATTGAVLGTLFNSYFNGSNWIYKSNGYANAYFIQNGRHEWYNAPSGTAGNAITFTERMRLDASGNLGLGVTPSAWNAGLRAIQVGYSAAIDSPTSVANTRWSNNAYVGAGGGFQYINNGVAQTYEQDNNGKHAWYTAPSGTAGNAISFSQAMTLDASGNLALGTVSAGARLDARSTAAYVGGFTSTTTNTYGSTTSTTVANATLQLFGGNSTGTTTGIRMSQGGNFELFFGGVQASNGAGEFVWYGYSGSAYAERMRLDASGNLGLGVTPAAWSATWPTLQAKNASFTGTGALADFAAMGANMVATGSSYPVDTTVKYISNGYATTYRQYAGAHAWYNAPSGTAGNAITFTQAMTLDASGDWQLGTTSSTAATVTVRAHIAGREYGLGISVPATGAQQNIRFVNGTTAVGSVVTSGSATTYNTVSDYRLKNINGPITNSGAYIDALNPVEGTWKSNGSPFVGLIAHETQEVSRTQVVTGKKDGAEMQQMDYSSSEIIANMIAELKSLRARVAQIEGTQP